MANVVEKLQHIGLTEYEAKVYFALLNTHLSIATKSAEKSWCLEQKFTRYLNRLGIRAGSEYTLACHYCLKQ